MKIKINEDKAQVAKIRAAVAENDGYCPCAIDKNLDTKCMCKEFRESTSLGFCHCGLYQHIEDELKE